MKEKIINEVVDKNHLLSIFAGKTLLQPFRSQPYLTLQIPFDQYLGFCRDMVKNDYRWLSETVGSYKAALEKYDAGEPARMYRYYYLDISKAQLNEIVMSVAYNKTSTAILHSFENVPDEFLVEDIASAFELVTADDVQEVYPYISQAILAYVRPRNMAGLNRKLFEYVVLLQACSKQAIPKLFNIRRQK